jgi:hypothetical protein
MLAGVKNTFRLPLFHESGPVSLVRQRPSQGEVLHKWAGLSPRIDVCRDSPA